MALSFRQVWCAPFRDLNVAAPNGVVIGVIGEDGAGKSKLLEIAAGAKIDAGRVDRSGPAKYLGPNDALNFAPTKVLLIDHTFARHDLLVRERAAIALDRMRRGGATVLLVSHEEDLLLRLSDEVWWIDGGALAGRGDPAEMLAAHRRRVAEKLREWGETVTAPLAPRMRRGDGRAEVVSIQTIGENGAPTMVWRSGELATVKVKVRFRDAVADPVVGMMIRTRIGLNVFGTNTELEKLKLGPCAAGAEVEVSFSFRCELCPQEYTLTVASHDPDGVWHDWLEDAVAFAVSDVRYTAGVANLRATARVG